MSVSTVIAGDYEKCLIVFNKVALSRALQKEVKAKLAEQGLQAAPEDLSIPLTPDFVASYKEITSKNEKTQMAEVLFRDGKKSLIEFNAKDWTVFVKANFNISPDYAPKAPHRKPLSTKSGVGSKILKGIGAFVVFIIVMSFITSSDDPTSSESQPQQQTAQQPPTVDPASKIAPSAVSPMTQKSYPKTYRAWGKSQIDRINGLFPTAALRAAESNRCDRVDWVSLSDSRSTVKKEAVFLVQCKNNERFYISEKDLDKPAQSVQEKIKATSEVQYWIACEELTKRSLKFPSSYDEDFAGKQSNYDDPQMTRLIVQIKFSAKNGFGNTIPQISQCIFDDRGFVDIKMSNR